MFGNTKSSAHRTPLPGGLPHPTPLPPLPQSWSHCPAGSLVFCHYSHIVMVSQGPTQLSTARCLTWIISFYPHNPARWIFRKHLPTILHPVLEKLIEGSSSFFGKNRKHRSGLQIQALRFLILWLGQVTSPLWVSVFIIGEREATIPTSQCCPEGVHVELLRQHLARGRLRTMWVTPLPRPQAPSTPQSRDFPFTSFSRLPSHISFQAPVLDPTAFLPSKSRSAPGNNLWPSSLFCLLSLAGWSHAVPWLYVSSRHWLQILYLQSSSLPRPPNLYVQQMPPCIDLMGLLEFIHIKQRLDSSHPKPFLHQFSHLSKSHHYYPVAQAKSTFDSSLSPLTYNHQRISLPLISKV